MPDYAPLGNLLLAECLAEDPFGTVHRGLEKDGTPAGRDVLVRRYHPAVLEAGLKSQVPSIRRLLVRMGNLRAFQGCHLLLEGEPHLVWPLAPGRSLAQVLERAERDGIPFGADQALFLGWALAHHISQLHKAELPLGFLTPHRVWVGFDGYIQLLDAPTVLALADLLPALPEAERAAAPYRQGPEKEGLAHDLFQLGALLFEMLTHHPLPLGEDLDWVLAEATLPGMDGDETPMPGPMIAVLRRLMGLEPGFECLEHLEDEVEGFLFDGDYNPTTFGLAFTMHTLFREEREAEALAMREERADSGIFRTLEHLAAGSPALPPPPRRSRLPWVAGGLAVAGLAGFLAIKPTPQAPAPPPPAPTTYQAATVADIQHPMPTPPDPEPARTESKAAATTTATRTAPTTAQPAAPVPQAVAQPVVRVTIPTVPVASLATTLQPQVLPSPTPTPSPVAPALEPPKLLGMAGVPGGQPLRVRVFVDETGRVRQAMVLPGHGKGAAAEQRAYAAALQARFTPARKGGQTCREWTEIPVLIQP